MGHMKNHSIDTVQLFTNLIQPACHRALHGLASDGAIDNMHGYNLLTESYSVAELIAEKVATCTPCYIDVHLDCIHAFNAGRALSEIADRGDMPAYSRLMWATMVNDAISYMYKFD